VALDGQRGLMAFSYLSFLSKEWRLRGASQPLQSWEGHGATSETETPSKLRDAEAAIMTCALSRTNCREAAEDVMPLRPFGACLTAGQPELILADTDHFRNLGAERIQATHLRGRKRQASGGVGPWRRI
jgi:hypothetical protein